MILVHEKSVSKKDAVDAQSQGKTQEAKVNEEDHKTKSEKIFEKRQKRFSIGCRRSAAAVFGSIYGWKDTE